MVGGRVGDVVNQIFVWGCRMVGLAGLVRLDGKYGAHSGCR